MKPFGDDFISERTEASGISMKNAWLLFGAMAGSSLLDDRDDLVLYSISISPVPVWKYLWFKVSVVYALSFVGSILIILVSGAFNMNVWQMLPISALSSMQVPSIAFLMNAFARNKVEGFVAMKAAGFLLVFPIAGFFFTDAKEWLFATAPAHWAAKAVQYLMIEPAIKAGMVRMNLDFPLYVSIGFAYNAVFTYKSYRLYIIRNRT